MKTKNRGFLSLEYALLIAAVVAALILMQDFLRRTVCGRWREASDVFARGAQYELP